MHRIEINGHGSSDSTETDTGADAVLVPEESGSPAFS